MKYFKVLIIVVLLFAVGSGYSVFHYSDRIVFDQKDKLTDKKECRDFSIKIDRPEDSQGSFEILLGGKKIYEKQGGIFSIEGQTNNKEKSIILPISVKDITGNGKPDFVVNEYTGGAYCCYVIYVFELGVPIKLLAEVDGMFTAPQFEDLDGDSLPEIILVDWTFEGWPGSFATSPTPKVILRWKNGKFIPDERLMKIPAPSIEDLKREAESISNDDDWDIVYNPDQIFWSHYIPRQLFQRALDLMYGGHEEVGRKFIQMGWSKNYPVNKELLVEFDELLSKSPYWKVIKEQRESGIPET